jgi:hypothetical protein
MAGFADKPEIVSSMRLSLICATCLLTTLIAVGGMTDAAATPLRPFRYEAQARRYCPTDTVVWLDFRKGIYYFKRQNRYAQGGTGSFVCLDEARQSRYRRSWLGLR